MLVSCSVVLSSMVKMKKIVILVFLNSLNEVSFSVFSSELLDVMCFSLGGYGGRLNVYRLSMSVVVVVM